MAITANINNKGFTLIEFLVAIVILSVGLLGLLQAVNYAIVNNMTNSLRQESFLIADERINSQKAKPFDLISTPGVARGSNVQRLVNGAFRNYSVVMMNTAPTSKSKQLDVQIRWKYKKVPYNHSIVSLVTKEL